MVTEALTVSSVYISLFFVFRVGILISCRLSVGMGVGGGALGGGGGGEGGLSEMAGLVIL